MFFIEWSLILDILYLGIELSKYFLKSLIIKYLEYEIY